MKHNERNDHWDKILSEIDMDFIPLEYITTVIVTFNDGKEWEIDIKKSSRKDTDVESVLDEFFEEYQDDIENVDFRLNTKQLIQDINKRTKKFLKVNK